MKPRPYNVVSLGDDRWRWLRSSGDRVTAPRSPKRDWMRTWLWPGSPTVRSPSTPVRFSLFDPRHGDRGHRDANRVLAKWGIGQ
jgi:hypothetical protein